MEARAQDGGVDTNCPHCAAPLTVPRIPPNPYLRPIKNIVRQMKAVPFPFPYLPQLIQLAVLTAVLALFAVLFITIGVVTQAAGVFRGLILDTKKHLREGSTVERSAQARSSNRRSSSLPRLRSYALFAAPDQALAFVLSHVAANRAGELLHAARLGATYWSRIHLTTSQAPLGATGKRRSFPCGS
ncbi:MAG: hypothetical protein DMF19_05375 [Verrucomicrobia bacterium]|nr:MAG: hypothetical protein DMF19_05375 [Verrucomicrobiota bacterium]